MITTLGTLLARSGRSDLPLNSSGELAARIVDWDRLAIKPVAFGLGFLVGNRRVTRLWVVESYERPKSGFKTSRRCCPELEKPHLCHEARRK
jgi:hypothetical protein